MVNARGVLLVNGVIGVRARAACHGSGRGASVTSPQEYAISSRTVGGVSLLSSSVRCCVHGRPYACAQLQVLVNVSYETSGGVTTAFFSRKLRENFTGVGADLTGAISVNWCCSRCLRRCMCALR
jgi:hypothetical protein